MRTSRRVKQKMYYATIHEGSPIYAKDDEGNIIYDNMPDGESIPRVVGETPEGYDEPIEFYNSITGTLTADEIQAFGSADKVKVKMTYPKGLYPFTTGVLIWKDSEVGYNPDGTVDENSADYRIIGVQDTGRHFYKALLEAVL